MTDAQRLAEHRARRGVKMTRAEKQARYEATRKPSAFPITLTHVPCARCGVRSTRLRYLKPQVCRSIHDYNRAVHNPGLECCDACVAWMEEHPC